MTTAANTTPAKLEFNLVHVFDDCGKGAFVFAPVIAWRDGDPVVDSAMVDLAHGSLGLSPQAHVVCRAIQCQKTGRVHLQDDPDKQWASAADFAPSIAKTKGLRWPPSDDGLR